MTIDTDAADRLAMRLLWAFGDSPLAAEAAALIRAQAAEIERLRAERDAAWKAGAEAMRKEAARAAVVTPASRSDKAGIVWHDGFTSGCLHAADAIRALPLPAPPAAMKDGGCTYIEAQRATLSGEKTP